MSLYGALYSGVSGLRSQSSAMGAISDNISNLNTAGYKKTNVSFGTMVTKQTSSTTYSAGGVQSYVRATVQDQGPLAGSTRVTDMAIDGDGFFVVRSAADPRNPGQGVFTYTRAGSFEKDKNGYLQNDRGLYLQGWPLQQYDGSLAGAATITRVNDVPYMKAYKNANGTWHYVNQNIVNETELQPVKVNNIAGTAEASTLVRLSGNLPAGDQPFDPRAASPTGFYQNPALIYDSLGNAHNLQLNWMKTGQNRWDIQTKSTGLNLRDTVVTDAVANATATVAVGDRAPVAVATTTFTAPGVIDLGAIPAGLRQGSVFTIAGATNASNNGTFMVQSIAGTAVTIVPDRFSDLRGMQPPAGSASLTMYDTTGGNPGAVYASQGRLDFTMSTAAEVTALATNNETFTIDMGAPIGVNTFEFVNGALPTVPGAVGIDLAGATTAADVASRVAQAIRDPENLDPGAALPLTTPPYVYSDGSSVFIAQRAGGPRMAFDMSGVSELTQATTRSWTAGPPPVDAVTGQFVLENITVPANTNAIVFNGDGTPQDINVHRFNVSWANGAESMTRVNGEIDKSVGLNLGDPGLRGSGMQQQAAAFDPKETYSNGQRYGEFSRLQISDDGIVTAIYSNGVRRPIYQIPVATFANPNGLEGLAGNTYLDSDRSGGYTLRVGGTGTAGKVAAGNIEQSNVELGEEFTAMIVTQRAYSAAAKTITTADEMLDELIRIKR